MGLGLHATMHWTDPRPCLLADACTAGCGNSSAACLSATPDARLLLLASLPCSCSSAEEEEQAAGWVGFWAGEAEEEGKPDAAEEEGRWTEAGCSAAVVVLSLLLLLVAGGLRATAELDRSVARSSS